jgi:hypothetical protein
MQVIRLIHWNADEAAERAERLRAASFEVNHELPGGARFLKDLGQDPPAAIAIDLSRLPSQGRDLALMIRKRKDTRGIPLVFVGGEPEKVERVRGLLPDAVYTSWARIGSALRKAIATPPGEPVVPESTFAAYAHKPLVEKLGVKENSVLGLVGAPEGFEETLGDLPAGTAVRRDAGAGRDLTIWFARSGEELEGRIGEMAAMLEGAPIWIAWPKKASGVVTDLSQQYVREVGLGAGLVDYKVCSIDDTWSGLLFTRR